MAARKKSSSTDLISRISDTISSHSRLSAAAAFQMGVLLGQVMHQTGAMKGLQRTMAAAPGAIASSIPTFGLFDNKPARKSSSRGRTARAARKTSATRTGRPAKARAAKRRKRAAS